jgi:hypothetical protein
VQVPTINSSPGLTLQPPLEIRGDHPVDRGPELTNPDRSLTYPDDAVPAKPYAIPGTIISDAHLPRGTALGRSGHPGGFPRQCAQTLLSRFHADPRHYHPVPALKNRRWLPGFKQPGGGTQYRVIGPDRHDAAVDALLDGYVGGVR